MALKVSVGDFRIGDKEKAAVMDVLNSGRISGGRKAWAFEQKWAEFIGTKYAVAVNSGTSALIIALLAARHAGLIQKGAKVITTPTSYIATTNAIVHAGLEPVFVDIDPVTFGISIDKLKQLLENSKPGEYAAVLPVHLMGYACDINALKELCKAHSLLLFEDAAQAHGTLYEGKRVGSFGVFGAFSFYIAHNIQAGELGAVTTNDKELYRLMKKLKANGRMCECDVCTRHTGYCKYAASHTDEDFDPRFLHDLQGYNFKTMEFPAALALAQIDSVEKIIWNRQENVKYLNKHLAEFSGVLQLPVHSEKVSYLTYPLVLKPNANISRKMLRQELEKRGVETRSMFPSIPTQQPAYAYLKKEYEGKLPNAEYLGLNGFYIGCHQYLTEEYLEYAVKCFKEILG